MKALKRDQTLQTKVNEIHSHVTTMEAKMTIRVLRKSDNNVYA